MSPDERTVSDLLARSRGRDGHACLSSQTRHWLGGLAPQLPRRFWLHDDDAAQQAARLLGAAAFVHGDRIVLGSAAAAHAEPILRHELVHLAQIELTRRGLPIASSTAVEHEAGVIASLPIATAARHGADPDKPYCIIPILIAIGVGLYVLFRPSPANAPGPHDKVQPPVPTGQVVGEAIAIFVVPGGAARLVGGLGLGFLGSSMVAGAAGNTALRAVGDASRGQASTPLMYLTDATTGAVFGFIVPGGFRLIGKTGTLAFDRLATYGMSQADIKLTTLLAERAAKAPLNAEQAQQILMQRGLAGRVSQWYLKRRGVIVLYRGQQIGTSQILSPLAQREGVAASQALVAKLRGLGYTDTEIASFSARHHTDVFDRPGDPPDLRGLAPGSVGIPASGIPGIAADFGGQHGVIYTIRVPRGSVAKPEPWPNLTLEDEFTFFTQIPRGSIVKITPSNSVAPLVVDGDGLLAPGKG